MVVRLGGDEFAVLLPLEQEGDAAEMAQAILAALVRPFPIDGGTVEIGASIGIAVAPRDGRDAESLMHAADVALYRVKGQKGRDYRYFEPAMDEALRLRREMKRELSQALSRDEFHVVYQPQVDIEAKHLVGFEALLRWRSPKHGDVSPMVFIPLAEESGLIEQIGAFVLRRACADATKWPSTMSLAVNLSAGAVPQWRGAAGGDAGIGGIGSAAAAARSGDHRVGAARRGRRGDRDAGGVPPHGDPGGARRFRHRLFVAELSAALPVRQDQDRPLLHHRPAAFGGIRGDRARHCRARPLAQGKGDRRGRRDLGTTADAEHRGLP